MRGMKGMLLLRVALLVLAGVLAAFLIRAAPWPSACSSARWRSSEP